MAETPDGVPCRHCGEPIFWDEICWVHGTGWANCGITMIGVNTGGIMIDPEIVEDPVHKAANHCAEPVGEWS